MPTITPFLWFESQAEEAMQFYLSIFPQGKVLQTSRYGEGAQAPAGSVMSVLFELEGQRFFALNGGPQFTFSPAVSWMVTCDTQKDIDFYWEKLSAGGSPQMCGWLTDKYGMSWQVVPTMLGELLMDPNPAKAKAAMDAMMAMRKLDIAALKKAHTEA